jgi:uncharacterized protein YdaU (DUF1376 family)
MQFYDFNIGDYAKKTRYLTNDQDLAYRRALDMYYDTEKPLDISNIPLLSHRLGVGIETVDFIIKEFFPGGINKTCEEKIAAYYAFIDKQKANGKLGGRPKRTQAKPTANPKKPKPKPILPLPLPLTLPLKIEDQPPMGDGDEFAYFWKAFPKKVGKADAEKSWNKHKPRLQDVLAALEWQSQTQQWLKDGGQFIPNPSTYLNQERWLDEPIGPVSSNLGMAGQATAAAATRFLESMGGEA